MEDPKPRLSNFEVEEKAGEAEGILNHHVFKEAMDEVYSRALGTLMTADIGSLTATQAHAMIKAVSELKAQLAKFVADNKMRQKYNKGDK